MYLKSIEVYGFKSFANKIIFEFHDGITGIVGPNGSGKSNVADAVRWVLGEQSAKQLRGAKMEDVIFSGTETRKPLGYAYVSLTINNEDHKLPIEYDEVTVARRVYRSGESEYLLNGNSCRLKDMQELFLDTGIGKEGYSIIGQGQIEKILSGKPEDRRELFDEAAGIVKFKKRRAAAHHNLEEERLNLSRIQDILSEIEKQVGPLEKQSAVAREYLKLRDELKELDIQLFLLENEKFAEGKKQTGDRLAIANASLQSANEKSEHMKEEFERLESEIEGYNTSLEGLKATQSDKRLEQEKTEGEIKVLKEQLLSIKQNDSHYESRLQVIAEEIKVKSAEQEGYLGEKNSLDIKMDKLDEKQSNDILLLEEIRGRIKEDTRLAESLHGEIFDFLSQNSGIKTNLQRYETILEQNNIKKTELTQKLLRNKSEEAVTDLEIQNIADKLEKLHSTIEENQKITALSQEKLIEHRTHLKEIEDEIQRKQQAYHTGFSQLEALKNLTERYEGYGNSIRKIMEKKDTPGIIGVVADIIKTEPKYETAVEIALGGSIQNIVTDKESTAKELIEYLKRNKYGRATFLPLTSISVKESYGQQRYLEEKGVIGLANTLVRTEERFKGLMQNLLGKSLVVDNIDNALAIAKKYNYTLRIITLDGELLSPGGSLSGGAYKNSSNLLSRRREIEDLEEKITLLKNEGKELTSSRDKLNGDIQTVLKEIEDRKQTLQSIYLEENTDKLHLTQNEKKKQELGLVYEEITNEINQIEHQSIELNKNINSLQESLVLNEERSKENEHRIDEMNRKLEEIKTSEQEISDRVSTLKAEMSAFEQNNQHLLENIKRVKRDLEKLYDEENSIRKSREDSLLQYNTKEKAILNDEETLKQFAIEIQKLEEQIKELQLKKEEVTITHKSFFERREELSKEIINLDKEIYRLNGQLERLEEQLNEKKDYMWEEYELTLHNVMETMDAELLGSIDSSFVRKRIGEVKGSMKGLGDVNINAIEDYKNLSERFLFLKGQKEDIEKAEETLIHIIQELDDEMRNQFNEKFAQIKVQFDLVFKELFGGGRATLELTEDEDVLEAGIIITSQPPGKKLQNMMQLSGGEKALTAISLLFAIQNLKPSPFCLLDEIEAALDDANVKRFAKYLHKLTKDTQFIIITHRRGTMNAADVLYGITMQEKGVSALVSVNLIENDLDK